jgi:hypothetical protein
LHKIKVAGNHHARSLGAPSWYLAECEESGHLRRESGCTRSESPLVGDGAAPLEGEKIRPDAERCKAPDRLWEVIRWRYSFGAKSR